MGAIGKYLTNQRKHSYDVPHHIGVRHAQHAITEHSQCRVAPRICSGIMRIAIDLDDQLRRRAEEIDDVWRDHSLPSELRSGQLFARKISPKAFLRLGRVVAHLASAALQFGEAICVEPPPRAPPLKGRGFGAPSRVSWGQVHPTEPSKLIPSSFCASTANSIGNCCSTSFAKPLTISATASSASSPRCIA